MAKHDQRILKFLTQNADRAPTITDMMTRLNISISDISDSLNSLLTQGLVSKRTNGQGIECWFPLNGAPQPEAVPESRANDFNRRGGDFERRASDHRMHAGHSHHSTPEPSPMPPLQPTLPSLSASNAFPASLTSPAPSPQLSSRPTGMESAVFTASHSPIPAATPPAVPASAGSAMPASPAIESLPGVPSPAPYNLAPVKNGIGFLTFAVGLIAAAAAAVYFSGRLQKQNLDAASRNFVERPALDKALASMKSFETGAKNQIGALEGQVKDLNAQVAALKATNDSLQIVAAQQAAAAGKAKKSPVKRRR